MTKSNIFLFCSSLILILISNGSCQHSHRFHTLTNKRSRSIAQCCDIDSLLDVDLSQILKVRVPDTPTHTEVKEYIISRLNQLDASRWTIMLDDFTSYTPIGDKRFTNIIATLDQDVPRRLVLAAHYDSKYFARGQFLGATDSAVPVALIIDLILTLDVKLQQRLFQDYSLQVIFFDGEEAFKTWTKDDSLYGSRHLADVMNQQNGPFSVEGKTGIEAIETFILLDLIGSSKPYPQIRDSIPSGSKIFDRFRKIEKRLDSEQLLASHKERYFLDNSVFGYGMVEDDHVPFLEKGVPVVHIIPVPFPKVWHTTDDDRSGIDPDVVQNFKKIFMVFLHEYFHLQ